MSSGGMVPTVGSSFHRLTAWFDPETAAVVTILLGLFQVLLSLPLAYASPPLPKLFILPLVIGILIVAGGSFTMANERNPSRQLVFSPNKLVQIFLILPFLLNLQGCACSNVVGLLGALLAFFLYCYSLSVTTSEECPPNDDYRSMYLSECEIHKILMTYCWCMALLLLFCDIGAVVVHSLLSASALKALKTA